MTPVAFLGAGAAGLPHLRAEGGPRTEAHGHVLSPADGEPVPHPDAAGRAVAEHA